MKKQFLLSFLTISFFAYSQSWNIAGNTETNPSENFIGTSDSQSFILKSNNIEGLRILPDGNVRIGANNDPITNTANLRIFNTDAVSMEIANSLGRFQIGKANCVNCFANGAGIGDAVIRNLGTSHNIIFHIPNNTNSGNNYIGIGDDANLIWAKFFNNKTARFDGKIFAKAIEIKLDVWADYVFKKDYKLATLEEVEKHINDKGHLPNIPSAEEVVKNGLNLGEMDAKLLEKIEELTLYSIDLNKKNGVLNNQIQQQQKAIDKLSQKIEMLEKTSR